MRIATERASFSPENLSVINGRPAIKRASTKTTIQIKITDKRRTHLSDDSAKLPQRASKDDDPRGPTHLKSILLPLLMEKTKSSSRNVTRKDDRFNVVFSLALSPSFPPLSSHHPHFLYSSSHVLPWLHLALFLENAPTPSAIWQKLISRCNYYGHPIVANRVRNWFLRPFERKNAATLRCDATESLEMLKKLFWALLTLLICLPEKLSKFSFFLTRILFGRMGMAFVLFYLSVFFSSF